MILKLFTKLEKKIMRRTQDRWKLFRNSTEIVLKNISNMQVEKNSR